MAERNSGRKCISKRHLAPLCRRMFGGLVMVFCFLPSLYAQDLPQEGTKQDDLPWQEEEVFTGLSLEELMEIEVTSVSKRKEKLLDAAAAVYVLTSEDLRRSGVRTLPDALRAVPGVHVAALTSNIFAVSIRGFNSRFSNKLLVMIDGRSIYTPTFAGVYWDMHDVLLEDVERIEVVRGPGSTLWGANAVNGVINVITKHSRNTQGAYAESLIGSVHRGEGAFRYGMKLAENVHVRFYTKYFDRDPFVDSSNNPARDDWEMMQGGLRLDWDASDEDSVMVSANLFEGKAGQTQTFPLLTVPFSSTVVGEVDSKGTNVMLRWDRRLAESTRLTAQVYWDHTFRRDLIGSETRDTYDLDLQLLFFPFSGHQAVVGAGYRRTEDELEDTLNTFWNDNKASDGLVQAFVQDKITLADDVLWLTIGSKVERNDYTGVEWQPTGRLTWVPHENHTVWGSVTRAVRSPSRAEDDINFNLAVIPGVLPTVVRTMGNEDFESEDLLAYEIGFRTRISDIATLDLALFRHDYKNLRTFELGAVFIEAMPVPLHVVSPLVFDNKMSGRTLGGELSIFLRPLDHWRVGLGYSLFGMVLEVDSGSTDTLGSGVENDDPQHLAFVKSYMNLTKRLQFDQLASYVDAQHGLGLRGYTRLDLAVRYRLSDEVEVSIVGQNLVKNHQLQFAGTTGESATEVPRGVYLQFAAKF